MSCMFYVNNQFREWWATTRKIGKGSQKLPTEEEEDKMNDKFVTRKLKFRTFSVMNLDVSYKLLIIAVKLTDKWHLHYNNFQI